MGPSRTAPRPSARSREYNPGTETDPLIRKHITLPPFPGSHGRPVVVATSGTMYSVWSVYLNYLIAHGHVARMLEESYAADYVSAASSACGAVLQSAIERAGGIDPKKVRDAMASTDLQSFYGNIKFNPQGQNVGTGVTMLQIQNAKQVAIAPPAAATGKLIYPTPEWDRR
jgi:hypothetical protein